jgi:Tat protein translocase TatB subunit
MASPTLESMFGIGMPELVVIFVVALVVLGPKRLPEVARTLGKAVSEFRRQSSEIVDEFQTQMRLEDDAARRAATKAAAAKRDVPTSTDV